MRVYMPDTLIVPCTDRALPGRAAHLFSKVVHLTKPHLNKLICPWIRHSRRPPRHGYLCLWTVQLFDLLGRFDVAMALEEVVPR